MGNIIKSLGVSALGLVTSVVTAVAVTAIANLTGFNIFTFSIWLIVPVGAVLTGLAAASGYYLGSLYTHRKPRWPLLIQMVVIAALTNALIYYLEYATLVLDDGTRASDVASFVDYMNIYLTHQEIRVVRGGIAGGEVGDFGYWLAGIQFVGFLVGGFALFAILLGQPTCHQCNLYLRKLARRVRYFATPETASAYYDGLFDNPVDSSDFADRCALGNAKPIGDKDSGWMMATTVLCCPRCKQQTWRDVPSVWNGRDWKEHSSLIRLVAIPSGVDMVPILNSIPRDAKNSTQATNEASQLPVTE